MNYTLTQLFQALVEQGASDLHIATGTPPRLRIDGHLVPLNVPPLTPNESLELCYSVLTESQKKTFEETKELDFSFSVKNLARFRGNLYFDSKNVAAAFRLIPVNIKSLKDLGMPSVLENLCGLPRGLVLVTGPTGSGKSTTLAAMIDHINTERQDHILTIEDPVEFVHSHKNCLISQREIGSDTMSFTAALKGALRQDPDVVMVGELRDLETISAALTIAETGHLVFGTLHTNTSVSSINRIIDAFPPHQQGQIRTQLAMTLEAVISQILIPAKAGGRALAMEILIKNHAIRSLITEGKIQQIYSAIQSGQASSKMQTMNQSLFSLIKNRIIDQNIGLSKSPNPDELQDLITKSMTR